MPPNRRKELVEEEPLFDGKDDGKQEDGIYKVEIVWFNVVYYAFLHLAAVYSVYLTVLGATKWPTIFWYLLLSELGVVGVLTGAHRLWSHRAYKAKWPLRIILMVFQTLALQNHIYEWCRDHRVHHKYSETDADPHNAKRGFFFAHMGWLLVKKHPQVRSKGRTIDMSDVINDPIVRFQKDYYYWLVLLISVILPTVLTMWLFNESLSNALLGNCLRYVYELHVTWLVNSVAHLYGYRPYDKTINPAESIVYLLMGEGYHNYHHTFPWDYSASELTWRKVWNPGTAVIDFFAWIGWAYDLKKVDEKVVEQRMVRTGAGREHRKTNLGNKWLDWMFGLVMISMPAILTLGLRFVVVGLKVQSGR